MIREVQQGDLSACVQVIRTAFGTVAKEFGITRENAPLFTAFAMDEERLEKQRNEEHRPMYAFFAEGGIVGCYSLELLGNSTCELNNLSVLPQSRHSGIGRQLLNHAFATARGLGCRKMNIGIVEENQVLRRWYESQGFLHTGTEKFDFFPFTCGYLEKEL